MASISVALTSQRFSCRVCSKPFSSNTALSTHLLVHLAVKPFECPHAGCAKAFRQKSHLASHYRMHTGEKPFACPSPDCNTSFKDKSGLNAHVRRLHRGISTVHVTANMKRVTGDEELEDAIARAHGTITAVMQANAEQQPQFYMQNTSQPSSSKKRPHSGDAAPLLCPLNLSDVHDSTVSTERSQTPSASSFASVPNTVEEEVALRIKRARITHQQDVQMLEDLNTNISAWMLLITMAMNVQVESIASTTDDAARCPQSRWPKLAHQTVQICSGKFQSATGHMVGGSQGCCLDRPRTELVCQDNAVLERSGELQLLATTSPSPLYSPDWLQQELSTAVILSDLSR